MTNNVDPDEMAHYEPSHLDLCCLQKPIIIACGIVRVKAKIIDIFCYFFTKSHVSTIRSTLMRHF